MKAKKETKGPVADDEKSCSPGPTDRYEESRTSSVSAGVNFTGASDDDKMHTISSYDSLNRVACDNSLQFFPNLHRPDAAVVHHEEKSNVKNRTADVVLDQQIR
jgi:hypothetical protein